MWLYALACAAPSDLGGATGLEVGDVAPDFVLLDQAAAPWRLADHRGEVVLIESAAEW